MKKIGFIDHFLNEWHADNMPEWIDKFADGKMKVCYAWAEIDSPREGGLTNKAWAEKMNIELCATQEEVIEKSDCIVVLSPDNSERHVELCKLALVSGKPVYVDKTFSVGLADAKEIVNNAKNTPYYSCSALRYDEDLINIDKNEIEAVYSLGPGVFEVYMVHTLEPLFMLMGKAKRVIALGEGDSSSLMFDYEKNRRATINFVDNNIGFSTVVRYKNGECAKLPFNSEYFVGFTKDLIKFFETGKPPVKIEDTVDIMSMLDSCRKAVSSSGQWINIE